MKPASNRVSTAAVAPAPAQTPADGASVPTGLAAAPATGPADTTQSARGTVRGRLAQLLDIKRVQHEPALSVEHWDEAAALRICLRWTQSQRSKPSVIGLSRLMALNFERARPNSIPAELKHQRLLPEGTDEQTYYREMIATFLKTVGLEDTDAVIDSFKKAGTGGLHRQRTVAASAASGAFSVAQLAASANLPAKTALSAVQLLMTALTTELGFKSANLRFRNSGTEEIMPLGKADATPTAKTGPNVMQAATAVALDLRKISRAVQKMESAQTALDDARARLSNPAATAEQRQKAKRDLHAAGQALSIAHASYCMRAQLKDDYKTASESAKIEYHGNKRALGVSVVSSAASMTATVLGVLTPVVVSATVTAGATAAAAALAAALYVGYQLSSGPSKDGEDKAKRSIVALAKSLDLLAGNAGAQQKERAAAYRTYIAEKRTIGKPEVRKQAKEKLLAKLDEIARRDTVANDLDPVKNWKDYAVLRGQVEQAGADATAVEALEEAFTESHQSQFKASTVSDAWKTPERMRFDSMGRVLLGHVAESLVSLHDLNAKAGRTGPRDPRLAAASRAQMQGRRAEVKASLRDWLHFELAQSRMKTALAEKDPNQARATLQTAAQALAAIENHDARDLFSNDARKQVEATLRAKANTIGERERYTMTNAGPTAVAGAINAFGATTGLALTIEKDIAASHGIHPHAKFGDQNDARLLVQGSAPVTAPYSAAERARFQKTGMSKLVGTLAREPVVLKLELAAANSMLVDLSDRHNDAALDKLLSAIERSKDLPDEIEISIGGAKLSSAKLSGTTGFYDWRYRQTPLATKAKFVTQQAKMFVDSVRVSLVSPFTQAIAQIPLATTRRAVDRGHQMNIGVRERLIDLTKGKNASDVGQPQAVQIAQDAAGQENVTAVEDSIVRGNAPASGDVAGRTNGAAASDTPLQGGSPVRDEMPIAEQAAASMFDPREAALALRDIPELGHSARVAHGETAAARPEAAFRPRPAQSASTRAVGEPETSPALEAQRDMMMGAGRDETLRWFAQRGISAAYNSGHGMDCLIISLLQHATGRYDTESEPELAALAARYRAQLAQTYPEIEQGDRMLYDDEPAVEALIRAVNRDYHADMNVQLIMPRADGPIRFQASELGAQPVGIVMFGNHFQAVHRPADPVRGAGEGQSESESERMSEAAADPKSPSRDANDASDARNAGEAQDTRHASPRASATAHSEVPKTGDTSPPASLGSRMLNRADETRISGIAAERARTRQGAGRRTSETPAAPAPDEHAFVRPPQRDQPSVRKDVQGRPSASSARDSMEPREDEGFVRKPKRDRLAARENVEAWLSANFGPRPMKPQEGDGFDRTPKRDATKAAKPNLQPSPEARPHPASRDPVDARRPARTPARRSQPAATGIKPWWEASRDPGADEVIRERLKALFDSAVDPTASEE